MNGKIIRIDSKKQGNGALFERICFTLENGKWAKTDLCSKYRNYASWQPFLVKGAVLGGLALKAGTRDTIDADCRPVKVSFPAPEQKIEQFELF